MDMISKSKHIVVSIFALSIIALLACDVTGLPTQVPPLTQVIQVTRVVTAVATDTPSPATHPPVCPDTEIITVPYRGGIEAVQTQNLYSGTTRVTVSGVGQSSGTAYTDAFYLFTDGEDHPITPEHPTDWILTIDSDFAHYVIPDREIPAYNEDHTYTFIINAPGGKLTFGVRDGHAADNSGSYSVTLCKP